MLGGDYYYYYAEEKYLTFFLKGIGKSILRFLVHPKIFPYVFFV